MVALSESVMKNRLKRPLAEKSPWRHIRHAIKHRYLGNHASQIKSYYGTLSGSHGCSFRIRHEISPEAPPGGKITVMSYPVGNKTLVISETMHPRWKVGMEHYQEVMVAFSESVMKIRGERPLAEKSRWRHIRLAIKPRCLGNHASQIKSYFGSLSGSHGRSFRIRPE